MALVGVQHTAWWADLSTPDPSPLRKVEARFWWGRPDQSSNLLYNLTLRAAGYHLLKYWDETDLSGDCCYRCVSRCPAGLSRLDQICSHPHSSSVCLLIITIRQETSRYSNTVEMKWEGSFTFIRFLPGSVFRIPVSEINFLSVSQFRPPHINQSVGQCRCRLRLRVRDQPILFYPSSVLFSYL